MKKATLVLLGLLPFLAQAEYTPEKNSSFSIGFAQLKIDERDFKHDFDGVGVTGVSFRQKKNIGFVASADYFYKSYGSGDKAQVWNLSAGPAFRFDSQEWLRLYPLAGITVASVETSFGDETEVDALFGVGAQFLIGDSGVLIDVNYKYLNTDYDSDVIFAGVGYAF